ncbi:hypothetical protein T459_15831 [Capsicum annuum]|uniref:Ubiquitin-like protease family profile domain-containing protein n=1 Tax=Capsicum annuum TaxID=4072 RepID=A0A2G2Z728_CAPAN|nr:hypothetical protein T459_15831 [Capsicum annuum]
MADNENAVNNIIKGFLIPVGLPWNLVDKVYVPINCNQNFHWVLAVIALKDRRIRVYNSLSNIRNMDSSPEIHKLAVMLPTFLSDSEFFEQTSRTDWPNLDAYSNKMSDTTQLLNTNPFEVEYVQNITQQDFDSLEEKVRPCDQEATGLNRGNGLLQNKNVCNRFFKEENVRLCDQEATGKNLESSSSNAADKKIVELPHSFNYGSIGKLNSIRVDGESLCTHCDICEDVFPPNMLIQGNSCQNLYCKECIQKYIAKKINYDIHEVKCPIVNCKGTVGLELLLPYDVLDRVENANREAKVLASPYIMDCPYEDCTGKLVDHQKC